MLFIRRCTNRGRIYFFGDYELRLIVRRVNEPPDLLGWSFVPYTPLLMCCYSRPMDQCLLRAVEKTSEYFAVTENTKEKSSRWVSFANRYLFGRLAPRKVLQRHHMSSGDDLVDQKFVVGVG